ncbi:MAG TPA: hypothetical protein DHV22_04470 [Xanthomarina gelatinilytica]|uniref:Uncharacterized protein n=1 Tax=Xanthomarina gelatinilytica TaxID=1137281 RepID=A0A3D6BNT1_9FLAO|nr:hypothetical protein [Xanthomarina gelatinilytica]|tara:strand:- start:350 stop:640 length:291 start_codon:yes stop_codon:yes gene_type:complete
MLINPLAPLTNANLNAGKSSISNAKCVLVVNGADSKRTIFLTDSGGTAIGSFTLPRYAMVKVTKGKNELLYAAENAAGTGNPDSIFVTFTKIAFTD